ncbi:MAG: tetratricopeptide repeat protein [Bacteroidales bacterium]|nr:tetratricopeptide repeat protein [Bacteroidales bacterium]
MKKNFIHITSIFILLILISSCSTHKDKWLNRNYHALTAHYNAYWNGNVALKDAVSTLDKTHKDDFTRILPVYRLGASKDTSSIKSNTDRAIEKGSKVIQKHSMIIGGVEKNKRIPEAYLLIGRAAFYQRDYKTAEATFRYMLGKWKEDYEAMVWLALTLTQNKKYSEAQTTLDQVRNKLGSSPSFLPLGKKAQIRNFMYQVYIENSLAQGNNAKALEYMDLRSYNIFQRKLNNRLTFIEGQIYQRNNDFKVASQCFRKTARRSSSYDMEFASKLNLAMCYDPLTTKSKSIISKLEKMLPDKKNTEFCDQIYYALGEIYYRDKNIDKACEMWVLSVDSSKNNNIQKIASSLKLADTYYDIVFDYEKAQMYYDTALAIMPKDYPNYENLKSKQKVLTSLVTNLRIITRWDSLMALSALPEAELNQKIDGWIAENKRKEKEKAEKEAKDAALAARNSTMTNYNQYNTQSNWYFYVSSTLQAGRNEFQRIWGKRELEDNWRLQDKNPVMDFDEMEENTDSTDIADSLSNEGKALSKNSDPNSKEYYTKDIPYTDAQKEIANKETAAALLSAGYIYYQGLGNYEKAIITLLDLQSRYPKYPQVLPSSYHLYCIYDKIGQYPNANFYKNKILTEFPDSEFAQMLLNPDYFKEMAKTNAVAENLYSKVYDSYSKKYYAQAITESKKARDSIRFGAYIPRLLYLEALSSGRIYGIDSLLVALNTIVVNYPTSEITPAIDEQLQYLRANYLSASNAVKDRDNTPLLTLDTPKEQEDKPETEIDKKVIEDNILDAESLVFRYKDMQHYYVLLYDDDKIDAIQLTKAVEDFNDSLYAEANLTTTSVLFTMSKQIISIRSFDNTEHAMEYYNAIYDNLLKDIPKSYYNHFIISIQNYPTFYSRKNIDAYLKFFRIMYLQNNK